MGDKRMKKNSDFVFQQIQEEEQQGHSTRSSLFIEIEKLIGRPIVTFFTSFKYPVTIDDSDADMLEALLQKMDLKNGLALLISSPGGYPLAAERIINICRSYSGTGDYWTIVPSKAKSAATMICFGSSKIIMGKTSELGTVDPQLTIDDGKEYKAFAVCNIVKSYQNLFERAVKEEGNLEPYLQQLAHYDERDIEEYRMAIDLSVEITQRYLATGMLQSIKDILKKVSVFLTPEQTKTHGRPIYADQAVECGLNIEIKDIKDTLWKMVYDLYIRTNNYVSKHAAKCIENANDSFRAGIKIEERE